jgi:DMSO/TMAO reductase YedYZ molybdopterin-dependent catalytic subunit
MVCHEDPLNCESSIATLADAITPTATFYKRNHFQIPRLDDSIWRLNVHGLVQRPLSLSLSELHRMPSTTLVVTLECAGNGRSMLDPPVDGEQWSLGAVGTAEWTGVPLAEILDRAGIVTGAREVLFRGADRGPVDGRTEVTRFERSLRLETIRDSQTLLAYAMNGQPLPVRHGYPLRVIVPGWYGVSSVKWLTEIELIQEAFAGYFQADRYVYEWERNSDVVREPVTVTRVRALITEPGPDEAVECEKVPIRGVAWSGAAPIARVEVSIGAGAWKEARLLGAATRHGWQRWGLITRGQCSGLTTIRARATDQNGRTQVEQPEWNRLGYGVNAIQEVRIRLR